MPRWINKLFGAWLMCFCVLSYAATTTLAQDVASYDWNSLLLAGLAGLLGGAGRTLLTLVSEKQFVGNLRWMLFKDLLVALIGGGFAYICIEGYNDWSRNLSMVSLPRVDRGFRVLIIVLAGASRGRWLGVVDRFASDAIANARQKLRGGAPVDPPSITAPLSDK